LALVRLADVICDTSFVIHLAATRIKNLSSLDVEIGQLSFVIPRAVVSELGTLSKDPQKKDRALAALDFIKGKKTLDVDGGFADKAILEHVKRNGGLVATLDKELKLKIKNAGGGIISLSNDKIVLES